MVNRYKIADKVVEINSIHAAVHEYCADYLTVDAADYSVTVTQADIDFERKKSANDAQIELPARCFRDSYLEKSAVYRKIAEQMPRFDTILFHASAIAVDGMAYLFAAKSGTGKSTHTGLWKKLLGERAVIVNDDKPLIRINKNGTAIVYGTPWDGKHRLSRNISVPLRAVCTLERASDNDIREITKDEAYPLLLQQTYRPADPDAMKRTLFLLDRLDVKLYKLRCNMDIRAAELSYNTMKAQ